MWLSPTAGAAESDFGIESVKASLSSTQAGAHPDLSLDVAVKQNPLSPTNVFGLHNSYAATRDIRFNLSPGLIGDFNVIGGIQQETQSWRLPTWRGFPPLA